MSYTYEFGTDWAGLKTILEGEDSASYGYEMDNWFDSDKTWVGISNLDSNQAFTLYAKDSDGDVVATYAARFLDYGKYHKWMKTRTENAGGTIHSDSSTVPAGVRWYSSCQWTHPDHRNNGLGATMDSKKKLRIAEKGGTVNYANHRMDLRNYHKNDLGYDSSVYQAFIPQGGLGGSGGDSDRYYYICFETLP